MLDIDPRLSNRALRPIVYWLLRLAAMRPSTSFVFENSSDAARIGFRRGCPRRSLRLMGAGVDPSIFTPKPFPSLPPVKFAMVSRMIWSKGPDLAVAAVARLVAKGMRIELDIYGAPDLLNQHHFTVDQLQSWGGMPGIHWHGYAADIPAVWKSHHVGLFPSRGGEGLPRAMLEAAACGRALITTDTPGCVDFVRPGLEGLLVEPDSIDDLERAIETLARQPQMLESLGAAARRRVLETATEEIIKSEYRRFFAGL
jgi:glycosyltransferase involved in cell wall biosynthesis